MNRIMRVCSMAIQISGTGCSSGICNYFGASGDLDNLLSTVSSGNGSGQNAAHGSASDFEPAGDLGLTDPGTVEFPDLAGHLSDSYGATQMLSLQPGFGHSVITIRRMPPSRQRKNGVRRAILSS